MTSIGYVVEYISVKFAEEKSRKKVFMSVIAFYAFDVAVPSSVGI